MAEDECFGARALRLREQKKKTTHHHCGFYFVLFLHSTRCLCFTVDSLHDKRDFCLKHGD